MPNETSASPDSAAAEAWRKIAIFSDGSGVAVEYYERALKTIEGWEAVHRLHRTFIAKHIETLAGSYWHVAYLEPVITISPSRYRGRQTEPKDIARLWPDAKWKRVREKYTAKRHYNWEAEVDGITLRIERAETEEPAPKLREGVLIDVTSED